MTAHFVDLIVIEEAKGCLGYAVNYLGDSTLRYSPEKSGYAGLGDFEIKYAWDINPKDEHYGKPYYER